MRRGPWCGRLKVKYLACKRHLIAKLKKRTAVYGIAFAEGDCLVLMCEGRRICAFSRIATLFARETRADCRLKTSNRPAPKLSAAGILTVAWQQPRANTDCTRPKLPTEDELRTLRSVDQRAASTSHQSVVFAVKQKWTQQTSLLGRRQARKTSRTTRRAAIWCVTQGVPRFKVRPSECQHGAATADSGAMRLAANSLDRARIEAHET
jgi:hypothetical protein